MKPYPGNLQRPADGMLVVQFADPHNQNPNDYSNLRAFSWIWQHIYYQQFDNITEAPLLYLYNNSVSSQQFRAPELNYWCPCLLLRILLLVLSWLGPLATKQM